MKALFIDKLSQLMRILLRFTGVNRAVFYGVLSKVWLAAGGAVTVILISVYLSPELQGFYFTFYSFLAMQVLVELGLTTVIINMSSHEWSDLRLDERGAITGSERALSRLKSLMLVMVKWFMAGGIILFLLMVIVGFLFFSSAGTTGIQWQMPWLLFCSFTCVDLMIIPFLSVLEGCNQVDNIYFFRFIQEVLRSAATWVVIVAGIGIWAPSVSSAAIIIWSILFLAIRYGRFFLSLFGTEISAAMDWWNEVWPLQWRIAVSYFSSYFCFYLFTPVMFHYKGAAAAGQMGLSWNMVMALLMISSNWIITRAPKLGMLINKKQYRELDELLFHSTVMAVLVAMLGSIVIFSFVFFMYAAGLPISLRFLPPLPTAFLLAGMILSQICTAQGTYLRAHKKEPLMWMTLLSAALTAVLVLVTGYYYGALGISVSYFVVTAFVSLPFGSIIWYRRRHEWHSDGFAESELAQYGGL